MDFSKTIFENRKAHQIPFLVSHRGVNAANIPCNTLAAYKIAVEQGADVVEIDVTKSKDGVFFVFHPGMEHVYLKSDKYIPEMTAEEIKALPLVNQDGVPTSYRVPTLQEVFALLKGKAYINVDKFWTDVAGITSEIYKAGVEKQVIVKTGVDEKSLDEVEKYAPELMFMTLAWHKDEVTDKLMERNVNFIGVEALFDSENDEICSDEYLASMHKRGLLVWSNAVVYNEKEVISARHTDDVSLTQSAENGWGWLVRKGFDFIQTDWLSALKQYLLACNGKSAPYFN